MALLWICASPLARGDDAGAAPNLPVILEFFPTSGVVGDKIVLRGDNLAEVVGVEFNGVVATFELVGDIVPTRKMIGATVPQGATTGPITVSSAQGSYTTTSSFVVHDGKPVIESFSPTSGPPGTMVNIYGQNLKYATAVLFNGQSAMRWGPGIDPININLFAQLPLGGTTGPITVQSPYGVATSDVVFSVTAPPPLTVTDWPVELEAGKGFILNVSDALQVTDVQLNGSSISFVGFTPVAIAVMIPTNAVSGFLAVLSATETVTAPQPLTVYAKPVVRAVLPESGPIGTVVTVTGEHLDSVSGLGFGNLALSFSRPTSDSLSFVVPPGARAGFITVTTRFAETRSQVEFRVSSGQISTFSGTIRGAVPGSDPRPITEVRPTVLQGRSGSGRGQQMAIPRPRPTGSGTTW